MSNRREKKLKIGNIEYTESELFENEEDRQRIMSMNELERETLMAERTQKLLQKKERDALLKQKSDLTSLRKKDALQEIKKKRSQRKDREDGNKSGDVDNDNFSSLSSDSESGEINEEDESSHSSDEDYSSDSKKNANLKKKRKGKRSRSLSSYSDFSIDSTDKNKKKEYSLSTNDVEKSRLTRSFFEKYWEIPIFDDNVLDCFVKINYNARSNSSSGYILGEIKNIIENKDKPYSLGNKPCTKYLVLAHDGQNKPISFNIVSNANISDLEFRIWKDKMEKCKVPLPSIEGLKKCLDNMDKIKNYIYSTEQFQEMINKKREMKIKNQDKKMNITYELAYLNEEYNSAKQKYEDTNDESYLRRMDDLKPKVENLMKMAQERERDEQYRLEADRVSNINKKNQEKQRINDLKNSLINRKKKRNNDDVVNPYKRRDCHPINLFDSGYLKKTEEKKADKKETEEKQNKEMDADIEFTPQRKYENKQKTLSRLQDAFKSLSNDLDDLYHLKKEKEVKQKSEDQYMFKVLGVGRNEVAHLVNLHNNKIQKDKYKILSLNDLEY